MAGYRPIGLSTAAGSTIIPGRGTYADRRRAVAERLSRTADIAQRLDAAVNVPFEGPSPRTADDPHPVDPDGVLRASVRALLPLACRRPGFDVVISLGPDHRWAARIEHGADGVTAGLVRAADHPVDTDEDTGSASEVAAELAALLWSGTVSAR
ncbi:MAG: hypothetical protein QG622_3525 [Actinomycetota bacterium]|nr:hypothetical protein [Actinomycetota bacterium]